MTNSVALVCRYHFLLLLTLPTAFGYFTEDFNEWLKRTYGEDVQKTLERRDLGCFGGKTNGNEVMQRQPVVLVHGVSTLAGQIMIHCANHFVAQGYKRSELYATTYADGAQGNPLQFLAYTMQCSYVKQVRALLVAVRLYTGRQIDVIGYSMGVTIARKAILGGEYLGRPLSKFIDTFVGVAGPNHGVNVKLAGVSVPACVLALIPVCNPDTGLYSGACPAKSRFLDDINAVQRYEGQHIFTLFSKDDNLVGYQVCGRETSAIDGQDAQIVFDDYNHDEIWSKEPFEIIRNLILYHRKSTDL